MFLAVNLPLVQDRGLERCVSARSHCSKKQRIYKYYKLVKIRSEHYQKLENRLVLLSLPTSSRMAGINSGGKTKRPKGSSHSSINSKKIPGEMKRSPRKLLDLDRCDKFHFRPNTLHEFRITMSVSADLNFDLLLSTLLSDCNRESCSSRLVFRFLLWFALKGLKQNSVRSDLFTTVLGNVARASSIVVWGSWWGTRTPSVTEP